MNNITPSNFIEDEIVKDLASGRVRHVAMRFPPEPTGYWHIGHMRAIILAFETAKKFDGTTTLRMDDTNPLKEDMKYVQSYINDLDWMGYKPERLIFASETYNEKIYEITEQLIKKGLAYVCDLSAEEVAATRGTLTEPGTNSPFRNRTPEENLSLFRRMRAGEFADGSCSLRAKIDMKSPNINMRDPVLYRILRATHYRVGNSWCIWPSYAYAHPLQDKLEGITFSTCDMAFEDLRPLYDWSLAAAGFTHDNPRQIEFSKLVMECAVMGKRHIKWLVENNKVMGWDDPRLLTIAGMRRRGYSANGVKNFVRSTGISKSEGICKLSALEHFVREDLNTTAPRAMAVLDPLKVIIENIESDEMCEMQDLPGSEEKHNFPFGREIFIEKADFSLNPPPKYNRLTVGGMVRLKGAYIIECKEAVTNKSGNVQYLKCIAIKNTKSGNDTSGIKVKGTIHFVHSTNHTHITIREFNNLIKPQYTNVYKELNSGTSLEEMLEQNTMREYTALAENIIDGAKPGTSMQFIRNGYFCKDKDEHVWNKTVSLKEGF